MSLYKVGGVWYIYLVHRGQRIRKSTGHRERRQAQRVHDELKAQFWQKSFTGRTWNDAVKEWLKAAPRDDADKYRLKALAFQDRLIEDVAGEDLEKAIAARKPSPATHNRYANLVLAILNMAKAKGWIREVPYLPRKAVKATRLRWLTPEEWKRLHKELPAHLKPLATFAVTTGLRQRNVTQLEWSQVDIPRATCWIHGDQAKAGKPIGVPLSDTALAILKAQRKTVPKDCPYVFPYNGKPIGKIKTAWQKALIRAEIHDFTWHGLRHTWASWHVQNGTPLAVLKDLGGWATMTMVMRYAHLAPEHLREHAGAIEGNLRHTRRQK